MATVSEYEALSKAVYGGSNESVLTNMTDRTQLPVDILGNNYYYGDDGFCVAVYYNSTANEIVISIRGTNETVNIKP